MGTITVAYQNIEESRINRNFGSFDKTIRNEEVDIFSLNGDFAVPLSKNRKIICTEYLHSRSNGGII